MISVFFCYYWLVRILSNLQYIFPNVLSVIKNRLNIVFNYFACNY